MAFPVGVITREVTFGVAAENPTGDALEMTVTVTPSRSMVWGATGAPVIAAQRPFTAASGLEGSFRLPVTDQEGWEDGNGNILSVVGGAHTHAYLVQIAYKDANGRPLLASVPQKTIVVPQGDGSPIDLDKAIPVTSTSGVVVSIPDEWTAKVDLAVQSAALAAGAAEEAAGALIDSDAFVASKVADPESETGAAATAVARSQVREGAPSARRAPQPVIAFSFDDGPTQDEAVVLPILNAKGVKGSFGPVTSLVGTAGYLTWAQLRAIRDAGHEILCHSATHATLAGASASVLDAEINGAHDTMFANGLDPAGFIWPNGQSDAASRAVVRDRFLYAIGGAADGVGSKQPLHTYSVGRMTLESASTLPAITARIDAAIAANEFLIFVCHSHLALNANGQAVLAGAIDYAQAQSVPIVTVRQGFEMVGNVYDSGDLPTAAAYAVVDGSGKLWAPGLATVLATNTVTAATLPGNFPAGVVSYGTVNNAGNTDWPVTGTSGNIITDRTGNGYGFVTQTFIPSTTNTVWIRRATSGSAWGAWSLAGVDNVAAVNAYTAATLPGNFPGGKITRFAVNSAGNTDWPVTGQTGNITVDRTQTASYAYVTQKFECNGFEYTRRATSSTVWGAWYRKTLEAV